MPLATTSRGFHGKMLPVARTFGDAAVDAAEDLDLADLVDTTEAARILRKCTKVVWRWRAAGKIRGYRCGGRWFYSRRELNRQYVPSGSGPPLPPTQAASKRRDAAANAELAAKGW